MTEPVLLTVTPAAADHVACLFYTDHQPEHVNTPTGWICRICTTEEKA